MQLRPLNREKDGSSFALGVFRDLIGPMTVPLATLDNQKRGWLLVGHGTREEIGLAEARQVAKLVARAEGSPLVELAFLEFAEPTIPEGFRRLVERGARRVSVMPLMLFAAGHAKVDIPREILQAAEKYPDVAVDESEHLGCHPAIVALSAQRYAQALAGRTGVPSARTALVLVGRGSHDASATREMESFAALRAQEHSAPTVSVGFVAMAQPALADVLDQAAQSSADRIIVQPHLLFAGILLDRIREQVTNMAKRWPQKEWIVTQQLGVDALIVDAITDRA
ncbi:MAG TPA: sirohydrochlorin chelatase, partial [Pirellulales bacterium]